MGLIVRKNSYKFIAPFLIVFCLFINNANAVAMTATPSYNGVLPTGIAKVVTAALLVAGLNSTDPRVTATLNAISAAATSYSLGCTKGWPCLVLAAGAAGASYCLSTTGCSDYIVNGISGAGATVSVASVYSGTNPGVWSGGAGCKPYTLSEIWLLCSKRGDVSPYGNTNPPICMTFAQFTAIIYNCKFQTASVTQGVFNSYMINAGLTDTAAVSQSVAATTDSALTSAIPSGVAPNPVPANSIADITNTLWKASNASINGGIAYSPSNPITAALVQSSIGTISIQDASAPLTPAGTVSTTATVPISVNAASATIASQSNTASTTTSAGASTTTTNTTNNYTTTNNTTMDLGTVPFVSDPTSSLTVPDASSFLDPIFNLFPSLKNYQVPNHLSTCPTATIQAFNQSFTMDSHCTLFESLRSTLASVMVLCYSLIAIFIVLRA